MYQFFVAHAASPCCVVSPKSIHRIPASTTVALSHSPFVRPPLLLPQTVAASSLPSGMAHIRLVSTFVRAATGSVVFRSFFTRVQKPCTVASPLCMRTTLPSQNDGWFCVWCDGWQNLTKSSFSILALMISPSGACCVLMRVEKLDSSSDGAEFELHMPLH